MIVAVDTGGTKTLVAVFDTDGKMTTSQKFPTPADFLEYLAKLRQTIDGIIDSDDITCLSVAVPGVVKDGVMIRGGNLQWRNVDVRTYLAKHYDCPIVVDNDANLAGLAEARALKQLPNVCLYVTVSTGIGTGVIRDGRIDPSLTHSEGGWMMLEHDGTFRSWETFASGKAIQRTYGKLASEITSKRIWHVISRNIASGLLALCPVLRPDVIVIGGGVGAHFHKFEHDLMGILKEYLPQDCLPSIIKQAAYPEESVIYGCYYHALDQVAA